MPLQPDQLANIAALQELFAAPPGALQFGATEFVTFPVGGPYTAEYNVNGSGYVSRPGSGLIDLIVLQASAADPNPNIVASIKFTSSSGADLIDNFHIINGGCTDPPPVLSAPIIKVDFAVPAGSGSCTWSGHPTTVTPFVLVKVQTKRV